VAPTSRRPRTTFILRHAADVHDRFKSEEPVGSKLAKLALVCILCLTVIIAAVVAAQRLFPS
jgi:hypothetical protein